MRFSLFALAFTTAHALLPPPSLRRRPARPTTSAASPPRRLPPASPLAMSVWSNQQAVQDYQDLLNGIVPEKYSDRGSCFIIGTGPASTEEAKLARFLMALNPRGDDVALSPAAALPPYLSVPSDDGVQSSASYPIYMVRTGLREDTFRLWFPHRVRRWWPAMGRYRLLLPLTE